MAQQGVSSFNIDPGSVDGDDLAVLLNELNEALLTGRSGTSRPPSAKEGTLWLDKLDPDHFYIKMFNGTNDAVLATYDVANEKFVIPDNSVSIDSLDFYYSGQNILDNTDFSVDEVNYHNTPVTEFIGNFRNRWHLPRYSVVNIDETESSIGLALPIGTSDIKSIVQGTDKISAKDSSRTFTISFEMSSDVAGAEECIPFVTARWSQLLDFVGEDIISHNVFTELAADGVMVKYVHTFTILSVPGIGQSFFIEIGATRAAEFTTVNELTIKNIHLEHGEVATDYPKVIALDNLARCHRFYQAIDKMAGSGYANAADDNMAFASVAFSETFARLPTINVSSMAPSPIMFGVNVHDNYINSQYEFDRSHLYISFPAIAAGAISWQFGSAFVELDAEYI